MGCQGGLAMAVSAGLNLCFARLPALWNIHFVSIELAMNLQGAVGQRHLINQVRVCIEAVGESSMKSWKHHHHHLDSQRGH
jgi:hypothetical protein